MSALILMTFIPSKVLLWLVSRHLPLMVEDNAPTYAQRVGASAVLCQG